MLIKNKELV